MTVAVGRSSCSNSSRFGATTAFNWVTPVTLPPGRLRLARRPNRTASPPISKTIGMVVVGSGRGNHGHLTMNQIGHQCRQLLVSIWAIYEYTP
jgi:hypothetical protein